MFLVVFFASGLAFLSGSEESLLSDVCTVDLTKALGKINFWDELGTVLGLFTAGILGIFWNLQHIYALGLIGVILAFISLWGIKSEQKDIAQNLEIKFDLRLIFQFLGFFLLFLSFAERGEAIFQVKINQVVGVSFLAGA